MPQRQTPVFFFLFFLGQFQQCLSKEWVVKPDVALEQAPPVLLWNRFKRTFTMTKTCWLWFLHRAILSLIAKGRATTLAISIFSELIFKYAHYDKVESTPVSVFPSTSTFQLCRFWLACLLIWTLCWQIVFNLGCKTCYRAKKDWIVRAFSFFFFALKRFSFFRVVKGWRFHRLLSFGSVLYETISIDRFWLFCSPSEFETTRRTSSFMNKGL